MEVESVDNAWGFAKETGLNPTAVRKHPWDAFVFYLFDPEGNRIELWQRVNKECEGQ